MISNEFILKNDTDTSMPADEVVVRGGHCPEEEGRFHLHRSDALRYHGYLLIYLAVASFIETVGGMSILYVTSVRRLHFSLQSH